MATAIIKAARAPHRQRLRRSIIAVSLAAGIAASLASYLGSSLMIPAPAERAETAELKARGADVWVTFCSASAYEPRFWPECIGDVRDWRPLGGERLIQLCEQGRPSRLFTRADCLASDRPIAALAGGPRPQDAAVGMIGGGFAALVATAVAWQSQRHRDRSSP